MFFLSVSMTEKKTGRKKNKPAGKPDSAPTFSFSAPPVPKHPPPNKAGRAARNGNAPLFPAKR